MFWSKKSPGDPRSFASPPTRIGRDSPCPRQVETPGQAVEKRDHTIHRTGGFWMSNQRERDYWWLLVIIGDYWWSLMVILLMVIDDYWWFLLIIIDYYILMRIGWGRTSLAGKQRGSSPDSSKKVLRTTTSWETQVARSARKLLRSHQCWTNFWSVYYQEAFDICHWNQFVCPWFGTCSKSLATESTKNQSARPTFARFIITHTMVYSPTFGCCCPEM